MIATNQSSGHALHAKSQDTSGYSGTVAKIESLKHVSWEARKSRSSWNGGWTAGRDTVFFFSSTLLPCLKTITHEIHRNSMQPANDFKMLQLVANNNDLMTVDGIGDTRFYSTTASDSSITGSVRVAGGEFVPREAYKEERGFRQRVKIAIDSARVNRSQSPYR